MVACKCWPGRARGGGRVMGDTIEKRYQRRRRGPLDQDAAPMIPPPDRIPRNEQSGCPWPAAVGPNRNADLRGLQAAGRTMHETCQ